MTTPRTFRLIQSVAILTGAIAAVPAAAYAGSKPSAAEAKKAASAWIEAMDLSNGSEDPPPAAAVALTATPFFSVAYDADADQEVKCPEMNAGEPAGLAKALTCLRGSVYKDGDVKAWTSKAKKDLSGPVLKQKKRLDTLAKTGTLVQLEMECAGTFNQVIFVVVKGADKKPQVAAVMSQHGTCGE